MSATTQSAGMETRVFGLSSREWQDDSEDWNGAPASVFQSARLLGSFGYAAGMLPSLFEFDPDVVHLHGLWTYPSLATLRWHTACKRPYVVSAHGMLFRESLIYKPLRKKLARVVYQDRALRAATVLHATSQDEETAYRVLGISGRVEQIPLGLNLLPCPKKISLNGRRRVLFLGRLHHQKGIDWLIEAWGRIAGDFPEWELSIVGPLDKGYADAFEKLRKSAAGQRVTFAGPLYGASKYRHMAESDLLVMPSRSENFGITAAEALMMGIPVIATKGSPWSGLLLAKAGWWVDLGAVALEAAMREALTMPKNRLRSMGRRGRSWVANEFSRSTIASQWRRVYESLSKV